MPNFAYTARDSTGAAFSGTIAADTLSQVTQLLRAEGKYPIDVRPATHAAPERTGTNGLKISRAELIHFSTQLSIMLESGVPLAEAMESIAGQSVKPNVKKLVMDLSQQIQGGSDFSTALGRHPRSFPRLYIALIRASEKSGMMNEMLNRATTYLRDEQEIIRKVRGAMTYPGIMFAFAVSTTIFLLAFVLPKFTVIYASKAAALPMPTKVLMNISNFVVGHWLALILGTALVSALGYFYARTARGQRTVHYLQLNTPLIGSMFRKLHLSRGLRMIGTMAGAGVNLLDAVNTAGELCANCYFRELWTEVSDQIQSGKQLSDPLFRNKLVPRSVSQMIHSAEKGGRLASVMELVAGYSERELKETIADLTRYIEPAMIVVMGLIIGGVAMAMLLPIFSISRVMSQN